MTGSWFELVRVVVFSWFLRHFYRLFVGRKELRCQGMQDTRLQCMNMECRCMCSI